MSTAERAKKSRPEDPLSPLLERIRELAAPQQAEVADFVEFLAQRRLDRRLLRAAAKLSEPALRRVWDNEEDSAYDRL
ncbi:MAG: toxin-antitoxin system, antitoxin component, Xre family protein [Planctomycetes bacterium]|nr:toxin-antitoxin system, antitoxin component, Xre family protein [Planctomycetota bacterium]